MVKFAFEARPRQTAVRCVLLLGGTGILLVVAGLLGAVTVFWAAGAVLILLGVASWPRQTATRCGSIEQPGPEEEEPAPRPAAACGEVDPSDTEGLVKQMLAQYRYALLLRPQIAVNLDESQFAEALGTLQQRMALVPDGEVTLGPVDGVSDGAMPNREEPPAKPRVVGVKRFFLDRWPVTNRQYFEFVAGGGYRNMSLWDESVLPAVLDFVDRTGEPGPRFWKRGCFLEGTDDHPVVGVCWHEAVAYARWVGKRLPSDAEWVKAGAWPVPMADGGRAERKYPWGDDMDRSRANLWGSGPERVVSVHEFAGGVSVGNVFQLIGNVWEWTHSDFQGGSHPLGKLTFKTPMKSIRGGAFDTYFNSQATCQFQSGDGTLARKRNIGFRLAIGLCDLVLDHSTLGKAHETTEQKSLVRAAEPSHPEDARGEEVRA